jgi:hypothetical protein
MFGLKYGRAGRWSGITFVCSWPLQGTARWVRPREISARLNRPWAAAYVPSRRPSATNSFSARRMASLDRRRPSYARPRRAGGRGSAGSSRARRLRYDAPRFVVILAPVLADFAAIQPWVTVELLTDARFYSLPQREADLVFRIRAFDEPEVVSPRLMRIQYGVYEKAGAAQPFCGGSLSFTTDRDARRRQRAAPRR